LNFDKRFLIRQILLNPPLIFFQISELKAELEELKKKERGLCELLEKTEEELQTIKAEVFQLFVSFCLDLFSLVPMTALQVFIPFIRISNQFHQLLLLFRTPAGSPTSKTPKT
jgi:hypothetical protein